MKSAAKSVWICLLVLGLIFTPITSAFAQTYTATVTGTVTDPQGGAVAGVKVVATNQGTKLEYTAQTSASGVYTIPFLPIGGYMLTVESTGFKKLVSNEIKLEVNQTARIDLQLQVGGVTEIVNVQDVAPVLQTESVTVGQVISGNTTANLPLNGRNFQQLTLLIPGTVTPNPRGFTSAGMGAQGRPYVNGNREQGNAFLLDGISVDETLDNRVGYKPNVDAIAEFKIETGNSSSEFGNVTGATVITTMKSGTNAFHGNVFEFFRNSALDANSWTNNRALDPLTGKAPAKRALKQNILGGTLGGPIVRNRTFFFVDYQGTFNRNEGSVFRTVAPAAWRTGNLSSLGAPIIDPQTCTNPRDTKTCQNFAGGIIPVDRIVNPVAKALFADPSLYPLPNVPQSGVANNYLTSDANKVDGHQFDIKIDHRFSDKDNVSGRYSFADFVAKQVRLPLPTDVSAKDDNNIFNRPQNIALNWTRTISPSIINEARIGLNRAVFINGIVDVNNLGAANSKLGIGGTQTSPGVSNIRLGSGLSEIGSVGITEDSVTNTFHYGDNLTIIAGRHQLKMGGQLQRYQQNRYYTGNNGLLGFFSYTTARFTGQSFADFLLDQVNAKGIGNAGGTNPGTWGHRQNRIGGFFQDDFKVRQNFTLNLGMRWEYTSPIVEVKDRQANFELYSGKLLLAGRDGNSRALYKPFYKGFEPRIGFAWTPGELNKLVIRAGYGITQYMEGTGANLRMPLNSPFFLEVEKNFDTTSGAGNIANGFTDVIPVPGTIAGQIRVWDPNLRPQFTQQYNLTLEYQLTNSASVSAGYVGHRATHLIAPTDWNQPLPDPGPVATWRPIDARRPLAGVLPGVTQISGTESWAISNYNSLQVNARQRSSKGLEFLLSYTLSKTLTDNLGYYGSTGVRAQGAYSANNYDRHGYNYGPAFFDATHNFTWAGTYDLPFGKARAFGANWKPIVNGVLGGWALGSIVQFRSGFPVTVTAADRSSQGGRGTPRPDLIGDPTVDNPTLDRWIDAAAFSLPAAGTFGSAGVGILRAPGYKNWDLSLSKKFGLTESKYFDFRAEFFNFTNTPSFMPPLANWSDPATFGRITDTVSNPRNLEFALKFHF
ncbi:MAG TPA: TonB-dependent receptor [Blastocatellia bacterium]|nr:TonB-dependent receptor [Blastocatellia bacterium]